VGYEQNPKINHHTARVATYRLKTTGLNNLNIPKSVLILFDVKLAFMFLEWFVSYAGEFKKVHCVYASAVDRMRRQKNRSDG
jgi:uncharacterized ion transporter superfamily protein YfcC